MNLLLCMGETELPGEGMGLGLGASTCPTVEPGFDLQFLNLRGQGLSNFKVILFPWEVLLKCKFGFSSVGWGLRFCLSDRLPGNAKVVGLWTML